MARGESTQMLGWRWRIPCMAEVSFLPMRFRSFAEAVGLRLPMLFTHSTRFSRARIFMACILESGSPSQSLEKQTMSRPCSEPIGAFLFAVVFGVVLISGARSAGGRAG